MPRYGRLEREADGQSFTLFVLLVFTSAFAGGNDASRCSRELFKTCFRSEKPPNIQAYEASRHPVCLDTLLIGLPFHSTGSVLTGTVGSPTFLLRVQL